MVEELLPQIRRDPLAEPGYVVEARVGGSGEEGDEGKGGGEAAIEPGRVAGGEALVDDRAQALSDAAEDWLTRARRTDRGSASPRRYDGRDMGPSWAEAMVR